MQKKICFAWQVGFQVQQPFLSMLHIPQSMKDSIFSSTWYWNRVQCQAPSGLGPHLFLPLHNKTGNASIGGFFCLVLFQAFCWVCFKFQNWKPADINSAKIVCVSRIHYSPLGNPTEFKIWENEEQKQVCTSTDAACQRRGRASGRRLHGQVLQQRACDWQLSFNHPGYRVKGPTLKCGLVNMLEIERNRRVDVLHSIIWMIFLISVETTLRALSMIKYCWTY